MRKLSVRFFPADRTFLKRAGIVMLPIAAQSLVSSVGSFIDTVFASCLDCVTAVGTALQIDALMQGITFGIAAGVNIYVVQFYGAGDLKKMQKSFGFSLFSVFLNACAWIALVFLLKQKLLSVFLNDPYVISDAYTYIRKAAWSYIFTSMIMSFNFAYHSVQKTYVPLIVSVIVLILRTGISFYLVLIRPMGISGLAQSLLIAQSAGLIMLVVYSGLSHQPFMGELKEMFCFDRKLMKSIAETSVPLVFNETLFSIGNSLFIVAYGLLGKAVMDCYYIGNQIVNIFYSLVNAISDASTSMIALELGRHDYEKAKQAVFSFFCIALVSACTIIVFLACGAPWIVSFHNPAGPQAAALAAGIVRALTVRIAFRLINVVIFSALRAGGDAKFLIIIDSALMWLIGLPVSFLMVSYMHITSIITIILFSQIEQLLRMIIGLERLRSGRWIKTVI